MMNTNFDALADGTTITLHPRADNPLHKKPVKAVYSGGYFYSEGTPPEEGPDYYMGDVLTYCEGYELA
jgi:hypothetical protein